MIDLIDGNNLVRYYLERHLKTQREIYQWAANSTDLQIWIWDAPNGSRRRKELYSGYKAKRTATPEDIRQTLQLMKELLSHTSVTQIEVPGYEADDVVATIALKLKDVDTVCVYSTDFDFYQLTKHNNIICGANPKPHVFPCDVQLYKATVGDTSDNIPGIKNFGDQAWITASQALKSDLLRVCEGESILDGMLPGLKPSCRDWVEMNQTLLQSFYDIVGFYDVPSDEIDSNMLVGVNDEGAADQLLRRYML